MTKHTKLLIAALLVFSLLMGQMAAFSPATVQASELASYYFDESIIYLRPGEQMVLEVHCTDPAVSTASLNILWSSDNDAIASVDNGKVTTHAFGEATITAGIVTADGTVINKTCQIIVTNPTLTEEQQKVSVGVYETTALSISTINANEHVSWLSSNEAIVTVDSLGKITGVAEGSAQVTATIGAGSDAIALIYDITVTSPSVVEKKPSIYIKEKITLHVAVPEGITPVWKSANKKIATVNKVTGEVKGKDAGTVKIYAVIGEYKASVKLTVKSKLVEEPHVTTILKIVNKARKKNGKKPLIADHHLTQAANLRAKEISRKFSHYRPDGTACFTVLKKYDVSYTAAAENIAYGQPTAKKVMKSWMASRDHRKNILNGKYKKIGIGLYKKGNKNYWVQLFTD